jgi:HEAT repeat protein
MSAADPLSRRAYFDAIVELDMGATLLLESLHDDRWFVVRNTAALLGEMNIGGADKALASLLEHHDERIRIAAARALIRLRTPLALAALHAAITDANAEVRRLAATSYTVASTSGASRPGAVGLAAAFEQETDEDVALEMLAALGRLGSADAVQRLMRIAQAPTLGAPTVHVSVGRRETPRPSWARVAALEALIDARGDAVASVIDALKADDDEMVANVARAFRENR